MPYTYRNGVGPIDDWNGGPLRVYAPGPLKLFVHEDEYEPFGDGLAVKRGPFHERIPEISGVVLEFDLRHGRLECIAVRSVIDGPEITPMLLRTLAPRVKAVTAEVFGAAVVRLVTLEDGTVGGEALFAVMPGGIGVEFFVPSDDAKAEFDSRQKPAGRPPLTDGHLERVADLYREAEKRRQPRGAYIAASFPNYSPAAIRNWIRLARRRGLLGDAPGPRRAGEQPEGDSNAE